MIINVEPFRRRKDLKIFYSLISFRQNEFEGGDHLFGSIVISDKEYKRTPKKMLLELVGRKLKNILESMGEKWEKGKNDNSNSR